ncbi:MAG TPA: MBL fold metallo-hydrolase, partial [Gammaproteobacteria bacterium]|nr:MBL fold metallo-hydrolase [Gammaproteobacteria bacterium]
VAKMQGFHERYMVSNKVCRLWANMVRLMDVDMIVPQHGRPFIGQVMVQRFLDWFETVECGIDRLEQTAYSVA